MATATARFARVHSIAVQPDAKVVVAGETTDKEASPLVLTRFDADGRLDATFGGSGSVTTELPGGTSGGARAVAVQPDGRIVAVGRAGTTGFGRFGVVRYRDDGTLDPSFSADGMVVTSFPDQHATPTGLVVQADGRIVVVGAALQRALLARYLPDGSLDRTFGIEGRVVTDLPGLSDQFADVTVDAAGNLVVVGLSHDNDTGYNMVVARYRPDGRRDPSFGVGGTVVTDYGAGDDLGVTVAVQGDGRIVACGMARTPSGRSQPAVTRYLPDGRLDPGFANDGRATVSLPNGVSHSQCGLALLPDGRIAVAGTAARGASSDTFVAVLAADGSPDASFDSDDGIVMAPLGPAGRFELGAVIALQRRDLVVATVHGDSRMTIDRLSAGRLPTTIPVASIEVTLAATPNPAGPGPLALTATVTNVGPQTADNAVLTLDVSKAIGPVVVSQGKATPGPRAGTATCLLGPMPAGSRATAITSTTVNGFEDGLFATATVTTASLDPSPANNTATIEILVTRDATM